MSEDFWESAAQRDPLWAILSDPAKKGRRWELKEFFETGRREVSLLMYQLRQLGHPPAAGRALDFGCGVGRLSQALASHFAAVVGVDVSPTMIRLASSLNRVPGRVQYVLNLAQDLRQFPSDTFDFLYSDIVLQHVPALDAERYVVEFMRVVKPGGIIVFQLPSHRRVPGEAVSATAPMDDTAYRARLSLVEGLPRSIAPGNRATVRLHVENTSRQAWDQQATGPIRAGNHWLSSSGAMLIQDDGRHPIAAYLAPGATTSVSTKSRRRPRQDGSCARSISFTRG